MLSASYWWLFAGALRTRSSRLAVVVWTKFLLGIPTVA
ncbi:hypothetical protein BC936DRAFT_144861 [Jimgerdemannia flammicorona]|uniref:Uncharacterized protein n=1 Tax=Jimgerdemannia flammicorona TaxID=994334 RepID=A0A433DBH9_9FUNG|nr:hypothetical protein BC936DRAFT_144861 [Jimgerdemannia flammicorona]